MIQHLMRECVTLLRRDPGYTEGGEPMKGFTEVCTVLCHLQQSKRPAGLTLAGTQHDPHWDAWFSTRAPLEIGMRVRRRIGQTLVVDSFADAAGQGRFLEATLREVC
jgi:hypothetical protein